MYNGDHYDHVRSTLYLSTLCLSTYFKVCTHLVLMGQARVDVRASMSWENLM